MNEGAATQYAIFGPWMKKQYINIINKWENHGALKPKMLATSLAGKLDNTFKLSLDSYMFCLGIIFILLQKMLIYSEVMQSI